MYFQFSSCGHSLTEQKLIQFDREDDRKIPIDI